MRFSVIIPVYNVEKYLEKCLQSILNQKYSDYEVIVVDDGSMDNSGHICDIYAEKYDCLSVFHIPNEGVSNARNTGLRKAKGEYIWFIDSDDYVEEGALEKIAYWLEQYCNPDMFIFDAKVVDEAGNAKGDISCNLESGKSLVFEKNREFVYANTSLWNRVYKADVIRKAELTFEPNITIAEDLLFNCKYLLECQSVYYEKNALYYYIQRKNSAMSGAGKDKDVQRVFESFIDYYKGQGKYAVYKDEIEYLAIYHYFLVTSVRMIRCGMGKKECLKIPKWFQEKGIPVSLRNPYVRKMKVKHILVFILLKVRAYRIISMLFSKF